MLVPDPAYVLESASFTIASVQGICRIMRRASQPRISGGANDAGLLVAKENRPDGSDHWDFGKGLTRLGYALIPFIGPRPLKWSRRPSKTPVS